MSSGTKGGGPRNSELRRWYADGLRFECTGCASCCRSHGEYVYVYLTEADIDAISSFLEMSREEFLAELCEEEAGWFYLSTERAECPLLESSRCSVYPVRPIQCATWPFWSENLDRGRWNRCSREICPGMDRGELYLPEDIEKIARKRDDWPEVPS